MPDTTWPASWLAACEYDRIEMYGECAPKFALHARAYRIRMAETIKLVEEVADPGARILDVAAAQGNFTLALAELGYHVTWNDLRSDLAGYVDLKREHGLVSYRPGEIFELGEEDSFDVVLAAEIIEHVAHPDDFLAKLARLVRPGGSVVVTTPNGDFFRNDRPRFSTFPDPAIFEPDQFQPDAGGHIFLLRLDELSRLAARAGLTVRRYMLFLSFLTKGWARTGGAARRLPESVLESCELLSRRAPMLLRRKVQTHMAVVLSRT